MTEGPYKLPEGWRWVRLGEVADVAYGKANPGGSGTVPVVGSGGIYSYTSQPLVDYPTVVIGRKGTAGEARFIEQPCWPSDTTFFLRWKKEIEPRWVAFWFGISKPSPTGTSATLPSIRRQDLKDHPIPLPPIEEQRRIVARVEELIERVREAKRLRQQVMEDAERLWQSALAETFPRPGTEPPPGWRWVRLGEVCNLYQPKTITVQEMKRNPGPYPVFGANGIIGNYYQFNHEESEVIVTCRGATCGTVNMSLPRSWITGNAMVATPAIEGLRKDYLYWAIKSTDLRKAIGGSAQPQITRLTLSPMIIPLPPLDEQRRIVAHLEALREKIKILKEIQATTDAELQRLEQAILDSAFRGEL